MTHRQVRATFLLAALIALAGIMAVVLSARRTVEAPVEVGVMMPQPVEADTTAAPEVVPTAAKKKQRAGSAESVAADHHDSPLYHAAPRDDLR